MKIEEQPLDTPVDSALRRALRLCAAALVGVLAVLAVLWAGNSLVDTISSARAHQREAAVESELRQGWESAPQEAAPSTNAAWATISIPRMDLSDEVVLEGADAQQINVGVGHYVGTEFPWDGNGNVGLAGHRTGWGQPFNRLDELQIGDLVVVETGKATYTYSVTGTTVVYPSETWVLDDLSTAVTGATDEDQVLTLTTCEGADNEQRLVVWAELTEATPKA